MNAAYVATSPSVPAPSTQKARRAGYVLSGLAVLFLLFDATMKVLQLPAAVEGTVKLGYPPGVLLGLGIVHHVWMYFVFRLVYNTSVPGSRYVGWYPLGNLVIDVVLLRAIWMCLTGRVNWRGTEYGIAADAVPATTEMAP